MGRSHPPVMFAPCLAIRAPVTTGYPASITTQAQTSALSSGSEVATATAITSIAWTHVEGAVEAGPVRPQVDQPLKVQNVQTVKLQDVKAVQFLDVPAVKVQSVQTLKLQHVKAVKLQNVSQPGAASHQRLNFQ